MSLPNELWRQIFRHAVHVPQLFYTSWDQDPNTAIWEGWEEWEKPERFPNGFEMKTKLAIVLVCRAWRDLGLEFLYEAVRITNLWSETGRNRLPFLVGVFEGSISRGVEPVDSSPSIKYGYGWWTKRIDCPLNLFWYKYSDVKHLYSLLEHCHNLQIFSIFDDGHTPASVFRCLTQVLQTWSPQSLRRFDFPLHKTSLHPAEMFVPPSTSRALTSLDVGSPHQELDFPILSSFENITTLTLYLTYPLRQSPQWYFPHLRSLGLTYLNQNDIPFLRPFTERHNLTLQYISLGHSRGPVSGLQSLLLGHPHLQSVAFEGQDIIHLTLQRGEVVPMAGISHLGITFIIGDDSPMQIRDAMRRIIRDKLFPDLKVLRMLCEVDLVAPMAADAWLDTIAACREHGMRVEDLRGQLLVVENKATESVPSR